MKYVFLSIARDGTTPLNMLLTQYPAIATARKAHLFSGYIAALRRYRIVIGP